MALFGRMSLAVLPIAAAQDLVVAEGQDSPDCNSFANCDDCTKADSWTGSACRWCPKTGECHAHGSVYNICSGDEQITAPDYCLKPPPQNYSEARAIEYAKFAGAAYCSQGSLESWSCGAKCSAKVSSVSVCNGDDTKAFVGLWEDQCLVSFQGTHDIASALEDLNITKTATTWPGCDGCLVHGGFLEEYNSLKQCVKTALTGKGCPSGSPIRTTGHSLGAAVNSLAMMELTDAGWIIEESYDFGKPRTGNSNFAANHLRLFKNRPVWRITHGMDPVPQVPPADWLNLAWHFEHVEPEIYYPGDLIGGYAKCDADDHACGAGQHWNLPLNLLHVDDHLDYMGAKTSPSGCNNADEEVVV